MIASSRETSVGSVVEGIYIISDTAFSCGKVKYVHVHSQSTSPGVNSPSAFFVPGAHLLQVRPQFDVREKRADRFVVTRLHLSRDTGCLELVEDHPAAHLVQQNGLNTAVQGVEPRLVILRRMPETDDRVTVLVKTHTRADGVIRTATEAVVLRHCNPGILE